LERADERIRRIAKVKQKNMALPSLTPAKYFFGRLETDTLSRNKNK
jgi:hypothetical protein